MASREIMNARHSLVFLGVKNTDKNRRLDKLSKPFSDILDKKLSKSIMEIASDISRHLRNVFTIQIMQVIAKFE